MRYQRGRKEPRRSAAGLDAAFNKLEEQERVANAVTLFEPCRRCGTPTRYKSKSLDIRFNGEPTCGSCLS